MIGSTMLAEARPVRRMRIHGAAIHGALHAAFKVVGVDFWSRRSCSIMASVIFVSALVAEPRRHGKAYAGNLTMYPRICSVARQNSAEAARFVQRKHDDGQVVVPRQRDGRGVHHPRCFCSTSS